VLEVRDLHSGYGRVPVLHGISLAVQPGEVVLVLGGNGAGKTTLMRTIMGALRPPKGTVHIAGNDETNAPPYDRSTERTRDCAGARQGCGQRRSPALRNGGL